MSESEQKVRVRLGRTSEMERHVTIKITTLCCEKSFKVECAKV